MHVITLLFNVITMIYMLCNSYASLNTTIPLVAIIAFDTHFKSLSVSLSCANISKKDTEKLLLFNPQLGEDNCCLGNGKITL